MELTRSEAVAVLEQIARLMDENRDLLAELDGRIGDGDLGLTMTRAFRAAAEEAAKIPDGEPGRLFMKAGMAMAKAAPSTMGTLLATGFMRGGKAVADRPSWGTAELAVFFEHFTSGIQERGKARFGDKTLLDVLQPAADALAAAGGRPLAEALAEAEAAAREALEGTKALMSRHGKAAVFREKTIGIQDPGGTAALFVIQGFLRAVMPGTGEAS